MTTSIKPPEPGLAPEAMLARAREMRLMLREQQAACEHEEPGIAEGEFQADA